MSSLPTGTVTFLFTDIEGSTRLVRQLGEEYAVVLAEHERLLRAAFAAHNGREIDTQGDAFFAAFARAKDAVAAVVDAQRALESHEWPEGGRVRVRMGLHSGEPVVDEQRYHGLGVHQAARVGAAAHGGQVLLSSATRELVKSELPKGVRLRDLGAKRLKDIEEPERLYQLVVDGLQADFPRLRTERGPFYRRRSLLAGALAGVIAAAVAIPVFALGQGSSGLASVGGNEVGVLGLNGKISAAAQVGESPSHLTLGAGAIWVTNSDSNTVSRVDPTTNQVTQTIVVGSGPTGIAVGGGAVWVANSLEGTVSRIDPGTDSVVQGIAVGNEPEGVAYGDGSVWVANADDGTIARIDAVSGKVVKTLPIAADELDFAGGALWVSSASENAVERIDPSTDAVTNTTTVGNGPGGIAYGGGAVWVTNSLDGTLSRINPTTGTVVATIPVGDGPASVAVGNGAVWVSNEFDGTVAHVNPQTNAVVQRIAVGDRPQGIAVVGGRVLVGVRASGAGHAGGTIAIHASRVPLDSIDTAFAYTTQSWVVVNMVGDGLTGYVHAGGLQGTRLVPDLAVSLPTPTDGGRTYTFQLRRNIRYSTGRALEPADVRWTLERDFELRSPGGSFFEGILGGSACVKHPRSCDLRRGIVVDNRAGTVTFHLNAPDPEFLYKLALPFAYVVSTATPAEPAGNHPLPMTGPYMIASYAPKSLLRLVRNRYFHEWSRAAQPAGYPNRIDLLIGATDKAAITDVKRGEADAVSIVGGTLLTDLRTRFAGQLHANPVPSTLGFFFGTRLPPFNNLDARRAVNYAADRGVAAELVGGGSEPTCQILPPDFPAYRRYCPYTAHPNAKGEWSAPDLAEAKRLVAASGTKGMTVEVWSWSAAAGLGRYVARLLDTLGYRTRIRTLGNDFFAKAYDQRSGVQIGFIDWVADYPAPSDFLNTDFGCGSVNNAGQFCDPRIQRLMQRALNVEMHDPEASDSLWTQIDRQMADQAPWLPLVTPKFVDFVSRRVRNYQYNPVWGMLIDQLWVR